jgi:hypothetical protein
MRTQNEAHHNCSAIIKESEQLKADHAEFKLEYEGKLQQIEAQWKVNKLVERSKVYAR